MKIKFDSSSRLHYQLVNRSNYAVRLTEKEKTMTKPRLVSDEPGAWAVKTEKHTPGPWKEQAQSAITKAETMTKTVSDKIKSDKGYPGFDRWASAPALVYVTADSCFLCPDCANRNNGSIAFANDDDKSPKGTYDDQWRIIGSQFISETDTCSHCNKEILGICSPLLDAYNTARLAIAKAEKGGVL